ncbi:MAG: GFA family protein [Burkholderiaceae bacterium]|nr:GFA family protein [Burkholderiaceae bacterium]
MEQTSEGQCLCGAVKFSVALPARWIAHCHCTRCQRAHGAAFVTWVGTDETSSRIIDPGHKLTWYVSELGGHRGFCSHCGSPMFFKSERWAGELHIARALFTQPIGGEPSGHAFYDTHVGWVELGDHLPRKPDPASLK